MHSTCFGFLSKAFKSSAVAWLEQARKDQVGDSAALGALAHVSCWFRMVCEAAALQFSYNAYIELHLLVAFRDKRTLETKLHDISHFKSSNQRKRLQAQKCTGCIHPVWDCERPENSVGKTYCLECDVYSAIWKTAWWVIAHTCPLVHRSCSMTEMRRSASYFILRRHLGPCHYLPGLDNLEFFAFVLGWSSGSWRYIEGLRPGRRPRRPSWNARRKRKEERDAGKEYFGMKWNEASKKKKWTWKNENESDEKEEMNMKEWKRKWWKRMNECEMKKIKQMESENDDGQDPCFFGLTASTVIHLSGFCVDCRSASKVLEPKCLRREIFIQK